MLCTILLSDENSVRPDLDDSTHIASRFADPEGKSYNKYYVNICIKELGSQKGSPIS